MKTLIVFYSYTGHTKRLAEALAAKDGADIVEIKDTKRPGKLKAYSLGIIASIRGKAWPIEPLSVDAAAYDHLILFSPVWAGHPAPAVYAALNTLPEGKTVSVKMVSASGQSDCKEKIAALVAATGCTLADFTDIKA